MPITLDAIWEALTGGRHLRDLGCTVESQPGRRLTIRGVGNVMDGTMLTVDRTVYEKGSGEDEGALHFASYGDDVFEQILQIYEAYDLPGCVARITESVPDLKAEVVGYAVACVAKDGSKALRLVTSWDDLDGLTLDEDTVAAEMDLGAVKEQLRTLMRQEFDPTRTVPSLEKQNRRAAHAQILLDLLVVDRLLPPFDVSPTENFWTTINGLYQFTEERDELLVPKMPVKVLRRLHGSTLVDIPPSRWARPWTRSCRSSWWKPDWMPPVGRPTPCVGHGRI